MQRTQIYLDDDEVALLTQESARTGASRSELIRRAVRIQYGADDVEELRSDLGQLVPLQQTRRRWLPRAELARRLRAA